jgi:hypothetical protein
MQIEASFWLDSMATLNFGALSLNQAARKNVEIHGALRMPPDLSSMNHVSIPN